MTPASTELVGRCWRFLSPPRDAERKNITAWALRGDDIDVALELVGRFGRSHSHRWARLGKLAGKDMSSLSLLVSAPSVREAGGGAW